MLETNNNNNNKMFDFRSSKIKGWACQGSLLHKFTAYTKLSVYYYHQKFDHVTFKQIKQLSYL